MTLKVALSELSQLVTTVNTSVTTTSSVAAVIPGATMSDPTIVGYASEAQHVVQAWNAAVGYRLADAKKLYSIVVGISLGAQAVLAQYAHTEKGNTEKFD